MGYWVASDLAQYVVRPNLGSMLIGPSTIPVNYGQFQEIINEVSAQFDMAAAKAGFVVPIPTTATQAYTAVKGITRCGITADVLRIVYTGPDQKYVDRFQAAFDAALRAVAAGDRPLPGAPNDPAADGRLLPISQGVASPVFTATAGFPQDLGPAPNDY